LELACEAGGESFDEFQVFEGFFRLLGVAHEMVGRPTPDGGRLMDHDRVLQPFCGGHQVTRMADHRGQISADQVRKSMNPVLDPFGVRQQRHTQFPAGVQELQSSARVSVECDLHTLPELLNANRESADFMKQKPANDSSVRLSRLHCLIVAVAQRSPSPLPRCRLHG